MAEFRCYANILKDVSDWNMSEVISRTSPAWESLSGYCRMKKFCLGSPYKRTLLSGGVIEWQLWAINFIRVCLGSWYGHAILRLDFGQRLSKAIKGEPSPLGSFWDFSDGQFCSRVPCWAAKVSLDWHLPSTSSCQILLPPFFFHRYYLLISLCSHISISLSTSLRTQPVMLAT